MSQGNENLIRKDKDRTEYGKLETVNINNFWGD